MVRFLRLEVLAKLKNYLNADRVEPESLRVNDVLLESRRAVYFLLIGNNPSAVCVISVCFSHSWMDALLMRALAFGREGDGK